MTISLFKILVFKVYGVCQEFFFCLSYSACVSAGDGFGGEGSPALEFQMTS